MPNDEACPGCGQIVRIGDDHQDGCEFDGVGADALRERKTSWDRQAAYDRGRGH